MAQRNPTTEAQRDVVSRLAASFHVDGKMILAESLAAVLADNERLADQLAECHEFIRRQTMGGYTKNREVAAAILRKHRQ